MKSWRDELDGLDIDAIWDLGNQWIEFGDLLHEVRQGVDGQVTGELLWSGEASDLVKATWSDGLNRHWDDAIDHAWKVGEAINQYADQIKAQAEEMAKEDNAALWAQIIGLIVNVATLGLGGMLGPILGMVGRLASILVNVGRSVAAAMGRFPATLLDFTTSIAGSVAKSAGSSITFNTGAAGALGAAAALGSDEGVGRAAAALAGTGYGTDWNTEGWMMGLGGAMGAGMGALGAIDGAGGKGAPKAPGSDHLGGLLPQVRPVNGLPGAGYGDGRGPAASGSGRGAASSPVARPSDLGVGTGGDFGAVVSVPSPKSGGRSAVDPNASGAPGDARAPGESGASAPPAERSPKQDGLSGHGGAPAPPRHRTPGGPRTGGEDSAPPTGVPSAWGTRGGGERTSAPPVASRGAGSAAGDDGVPGGGEAGPPTASGSPASPSRPGTPAEYGGDGVAGPPSSRGVGNVPGDQATSPASPASPTAPAREGAGGPSHGGPGASDPTPPLVRPPSGSRPSDAPPPPSRPSRPDQVGDETPTRESASHGAGTAGRTDGARDGQPVRRGPGGATDNDVASIAPPRSSELSGTHNDAARGGESSAPAEGRRAGSGPGTPASDRSGPGRSGAEHTGRRTHAGEEGQHADAGEGRPLGSDDTVAAPPREVEWVIDKAHERGMPAGEAYGWAKKYQDAYESGDRRGIEQVKSDFRESLKEPLDSVGPRASGSTVGREDAWQAWALDRGRAEGMPPAEVVRWGERFDEVFGSGDRHARGSVKAEFGSRLGELRDHDAAGADRPVPAEPEPPRALGGRRGEDGELLPETTGHGRTGTGGADGEPTSQPVRRAGGGRDGGDAQREAGPSENHTTAVAPRPPQHAPARDRLQRLWDDIAEHEDGRDVDGGALVATGHRTPTTSRSADGDGRGVPDGDDAVQGKQIDGSDPVSRPAPSDTSRNLPRGGEDPTPAWGAVPPDGPGRRPGRSDLGYATGLPAGGRPVGSDEPSGADGPPPETAPVSPVGPARVSPGDADASAPAGPAPDEEPEPNGDSPLPGRGTHAGPASPPAAAPGETGAATGTSAAEAATSGTDEAKETGPARHPAQRDAGAPPTESGPDGGEGGRSEADRRSLTHLDAEILRAEVNLELGARGSVTTEQSRRAHRALLPDWLLRHPLRVRGVGIAQVLLTGSTLGLAGGAPLHAPAVPDESASSAGSREAGELASGAPSTGRLSESDDEWPGDLLVDEAPRQGGEDWLDDLVGPLGEGWLRDDALTAGWRLRHVAYEQGLDAEVGSSIRGLLGLPAPDPVPVDALRDAVRWILEADEGALVDFLRQSDGRDAGELLPFVLDDDEGGAGEAPSPSEGASSAEESEGEGDPFYLENALRSRPVPGSTFHSSAVTLPFGLDVRSLPSRYGDPGDATGDVSANPARDEAGDIVIGMQAVELSPRESAARGAGRDARGLVLPRQPMTRDYHVIDETGDDVLWSSPPVGGGWQRMGSHAVHLPSQSPITTTASSHPWLRVSGDRTIALLATEDGSIIMSQRVYATRQAVDRANERLTRHGAGIGLKTDESKAIVLHGADGTEGEPLYGVEPEFHSPDGRAQNEACRDFAQEVAGGNRAPLSHLVFRGPGEEAPSTASINGLDGWEITGTHNVAHGLSEVARGKLPAGTAKPSRAAAWAAQDTGRVGGHGGARTPGREYGSALAPDGELSEPADAAAEAMGVNRFAWPRVGEGYVVQGISALDDAGNQDFQHNHTLPSRADDRFFGYHFAQVVLASEDGEDHVTLENFSRGRRRELTMRSYLEANLRDLSEGQLTDLKDSLARAIASAHLDGSEDEAADLGMYSGVVDALLGSQLAWAHVLAQPAGSPERAAAETAANSADLKAMKAMERVAPFAPGTDQWHFKIYSRRPGESFHEYNGGLAAGSSPSVANPFTAVVLHGQTPFSLHTSIRFDDNSHTVEQQDWKFDRLGLAIARIMVWNEDSGVPMPRITVTGKSSTVLGPVGGVLPNQRAKLRAQAVVAALKDAVGLHLGRLQQGARGRPLTVADLPAPTVRTVRVPHAGPQGRETTVETDDRRTVRPRPGPAQPPGRAADPPARARTPASARSGSRSLPGPRVHRGLRGGSADTGLDPIAETWPLGRPVTVSEPRHGGARRMSPETAVRRTAGAVGRTFAFLRPHPHRSTPSAYEVTDTGRITLPGSAPLPAGGWIRFGDDFVQEGSGALLRGDSGWIGTASNADLLLEVLGPDVVPYRLAADSRGLYLIPDTARVPDADAVHIPFPTAAYGQGAPPFTAADGGTAGLSRPDERPGGSGEFRGGHGPEGEPLDADAGNAPDGPATQAAPAPAPPAGGAEPTGREGASRPRSSGPPAEGTLDEPALTEYQAIQLTRAMLRPAFVPHDGESAAHALNSVAPGESAALAGRPWPAEAAELRALVADRLAEDLARRPSARTYWPHIDRLALPGAPMPEHGPADGARTDDERTDDRRAADIADMRAGAGSARADRLLVAAGAEVLGVHVHVLPPSGPRWEAGPRHGRTVLVLSLPDGGPGRARWAGSVPFDGGRDRSSTEPPAGPRAPSPPVPPDAPTAPPPREREDQSPPAVAFFGADPRPPEGSRDAEPRSAGTGRPETESSP